jgi:hypothetical protein
MNLWIRQTAEGRLAAAVTNASFDEAIDVELLLQAKAEKVRVWNMDNESTVVESTGVDGPYRRFVLPTIPPWEIRLIVTE